jgi:hypothetical protein
MIDLTQIKKDRFLYLSKMYEESGGNENAVFNMTEVGKELGLNYDIVKKIVDYLIGENLVEAHALGGAIRLTHWGIKEVEQAYEHPTEATEHFSPIVNYNINITSSGQGSVINTGNSNSISITNDTAANEMLEKIAEIIAVIKNDDNISDEIRQNAIVVFDDLRTEIQSGKASNNLIDKVFAYGGSIGSIGSLVVGLIQLFSK